MTDSRGEGSKVLDISFEKSKAKKVKTEKPKAKRVITQTSIWKFTQEELLYDNQYQVLNDPAHKSHDFVLKQIRGKITNYKTQDVDKGKYDPTLFITANQVLDKLRGCALACYYCKQKTNILYEYVREPTQWTLERIDNSIGHTCDNVVISCLSCNLRRRTMYHERFIFTKNLVINKSV
jgi:hypothetical protein